MIQDFDETEALPDEDKWIPEIRIESTEITAKKRKLKAKWTCDVIPEPRWRRALRRLRKVRGQ